MKRIMFCLVDNLTEQLLFRTVCFNILYLMMTSTVKGSLVFSAVVYRLEVVDGAEEFLTGAESSHKTRQAVNTATTTLKVSSSRGPGRPSTQPLPF